jgi:dTDP-glucose 4,6-dehydratase
VEGVYRLLNSSESLPVNIGNPNEITILNFAETVNDMSGSDSPIHFVQPEDARTKDDPQQRRPDITKARKILDWEPLIDLEEGLTKTIDYFREKEQ